MLKNTGMRRSEAWGLKWQNIDLNQQVIWIVEEDGATIKAGKEAGIPLSNQPLEFIQAEAPDPMERYYLDDGMGHRHFKNADGLTRAMLRHFEKLNIRGPKVLHG